MGVQMSQLLMNLFGRPNGFLRNIGGRIMAATNKDKINGLCHYWKYNVMIES